MSEIAGVPLERFEDPIRWGLSAYRDCTDNALGLDLDGACQLQLTPDGPNSARSRTTACFERDRVGDLYVIAFKPSDGTGDENTHHLADLEVADGLPKKPKVVPRSKQAAAAEALLTLSQHLIDSPHADPILFGGQFNMLGLRPGERKRHRIQTVAQLGQSAVGPNQVLGPCSTFTTGYNRYKRRFGDPHSIFSLPSTVVQVCAFLAVTPEVAQRHPSLFGALQTREPHWLSA